MTSKRTLGLLFGGRSCEHEVSVVSARSVLAAIDHDRYDIVLIGIDKQGYWHAGPDIDGLTHEKEVRSLDAPGTPAGSALVSMAIHHQGNLTASPLHTQPTPHLDVIFPVLHGTFGEDGTIQGVLEMAGIPYVGCGVVSSAIAMDKALAKQVFLAADIPQAPSMVLHRKSWNESAPGLMAKAIRRFGLPIFAKPANLGSSVGIGKAHDPWELDACIRDAFRYDNKVVIEQAMENCQEVECSVLGNQSPEASVVGEIIPGAEFYDYQTKYIDDKSRTVIPADIPDHVSERVRELSVQAFRAIDGSGLARVDFFVHRDTREVYLNEINTLPGFTPISMYPKLWEASGIPYAELIDRLVELAFERHAMSSRLQRSF